VPGPLSAFVVDENHRSLMPAAVPAERIEVVGVQLQAAARQHERAWDPGRLEAKDARTGVDGFLNCGAIDHA
jgi:hypothetical protein